MQLGNSISIFLSEYLIWSSVFIIPYLFIKKEPHDLIRIVVTVVMVFTVSEILKTLVSAPRPFVEGGFKPLINVPLREYYASFPSGHASFMAALATAAFFTDKAVGVVFFVIAALVSLGRVLVGVHFPIDVFGGLGIGVLIAVLVNIVHGIFPFW